MLARLLNPGEIYYFSDNSYVLCVQGHEEETPVVVGTPPLQHPTLITHPLQQPPLLPQLHIEGKVTKELSEDHEKTETSDRTLKTPPSSPKVILIFHSTHGGGGLECFLAIGRFASNNAIGSHSH